MGVYFMTITKGDDDIADDKLPRFKDATEALLAYDAGLVDLLASAEDVVDDLARADVLELGAHERAALAGLDVEKLDDAPDVAVPEEGEAVAEVLGGSHAWRGDTVQKG